VLRMRYAYYAYYCVSSSPYTALQKYLASGFPFSWFLNLSLRDIC